MLSHRELEILRYIKDHGRVSETDVVNAFDPQNRATETAGLFRSLCRLGFVSLSHAIGAYSITPAGVSALLNEEEIREHRAKDERHKSRQDKMGLAQVRLNLAQVIIALLNFLLGLFVEYASGIVDTFLSLFR